MIHNLCFIGMFKMLINKVLRYFIDHKSTGNIDLCLLLFSLMFHNSSFIGMLELLINKVLRYFIGHKATGNIDLCL